MKLADYPDVAQASSEEKMEFVNEILSSIPLDDSLNQVPKRVKQELDRRRAAYEADPSRGLTIEQVRQHMRERFGFR